ncbi:uncharacterized protein LOC102453010 isoform X5 [Pelodiscus sinensis]|uniref:uncharacterized protein LOC102453010 isoform X5 n=1 Tax=Pelodiscus sinensis TaxID=13735 RepID=UPI003F6C5EAD
MKSPGVRCPMVGSCCFPPGADTGSQTSSQLCCARHHSTHTVLEGLESKPTTPKGQGSRGIRDIWRAAKDDSVFQHQHINILLKEQLQRLCQERNNIKASIGDVKKATSSMEAELSRIKQAETMKTLLEAELQTAKKTLEEEHVSASEKEIHLWKLEKDNEDLHVRILMLSEEISSLTGSRRASQHSHMQLWAHVHKLQKKLQESKLASDAEDEIFRKEDKIRGKGKKQRKHFFGGRLNPKWILVVLWHLTGMLLAILLAATLVTLFVLWTCVSEHTVTEAYHQPIWQFLDYYLWPHMKLHSSGMLPK